MFDCGHRGVRLLGRASRLPGDGGREPPSGAISIALRRGAVGLPGPGGGGREPTGSSTTGAFRSVPTFDESRDGPAALPNVRSPHTTSIATAPSTESRPCSFRYASHNAMNAGTCSTFFAMI